jgi:hypothetical protein
MTTWTFGSTALTTYGKVTLINDYLDLAERRGENITIPYRDGRVFVQKFYDERKLSFGIALSTASATALETAIDALKAKVALPTQQTLAQTMEDTTVRNIQATVDELIEPDRITNGLMKYVLTFRCTSPYFRLSTAIADNTLAINATPKAMTVTNPGTVTERDPTIIIHGAFTSLTITNSTTGASLTYTGAISTSETVTIGTAATGEYYATLSTGSANVIGNITHAGASCLLDFFPGANTLAIVNAGRDANSTVKISFNAPFI